MNCKVWWKSRTIAANAVSLALVVLPLLAMQVELFDPRTIQWFNLGAAVASALAIYFRIKTTQPIG